MALRSKSPTFPLEFWFCALLLSSCLAKKHDILPKLPNNVKQQHADISTLQTDTTTPGCSSNEYGCRNGMCVPDHFECDGAIGCTDASDEDNCDSVICDVHLSIHRVRRSCSDFRVYICFSPAVTTSFNLKVLNNQTGEVIKNNDIPVSYSGNGETSYAYAICDDFLVNCRDGLSCEDEIVLIFEVNSDVDLCESVVHEKLFGDQDCANSSDDESPISTQTPGRDECLNGEGAYRYRSMDVLNVIDTALDAEECCIACSLDPSCNKWQFNGSGMNTTCVLLRNGRPTSDAEWVRNQT